MDNAGARNHQHIVTSYDQELKQLRENLIRMGGLAEAQLDASIQAIVRRDVSLADRILRDDDKIDFLEQEIDSQVVRLLALRQPIGADLREIISALKIASDLERIGDYAANVAKRAMALSMATPVRTMNALPRMGFLAQEIIKDVLDAMVEQDEEKAVTARRRDEELDELYTSLFRELLTYMMEDPRTITPCTHLLFIAKNVERIGDHATNIAETIYFQITGKQLDERRKKRDQSSFAVVNGVDDLPDQALSGMPDEMDGGASEKDQN